MKILLLGKDGQVGWELQRSLCLLGELVALGRNSASNPKQLCGDLTDLEGLAQTVRTVAPDVIVNAAAHTAVDKAESEPDLARTLNALAPGVLASEAEKLGAWLVHYSTDYVFDGMGSSAWSETDACTPINVYGQTKLEGELRIRAVCQNHLILRTSWVYGARGGNFAKTMLRLARERDSLNVISDQIGAPTSSELLADVAAHAIRVARTQPQLAGTYHSASGGETTRYGYAKHVLAKAQALGWTLKVGPDLVGAIPTSSYPTPARRPLNSRLNTHRLQSAFGLQLPDWQVQVDRMLTEITGEKTS
ncbi:MAG: hypothetical protein RL459_480 [Pseudomonadota bacterium]